MYVLSYSTLKMGSFYLDTLYKSSLWSLPYAIVNQLWGPYGKIYGPKFWRTDQMKWGPYKKLRSEQKTKVRIFSVWNEQLVNKSSIV